MYLHPWLNVGPGVTNGYLQERSFVCVGSLQCVGQFGKLETKLASMGRNSSIPLKSCVTRVL
jgi:hypothetical protein